MKEDEQPPAEPQRPLRNGPAPEPPKLFRIVHETFRQGEGGAPGKSVATTRCYLMGSMDAVHAFVTAAGYTGDEVVEEGYRLITEADVTALTSLAKQHEETRARIDQLTAVPEARR